jgi:glucokinase
MEGASGTAGELGHMTIDWQGECCTCGNIGCLEALSSGTAIARQAQEAIRAGQGNDLIAFVRAMHQQADGVRDPPVISRQEYGEQDEF